MTFQQITQKLLDKGISKVNITYSGSGDIGAIDTISYFDSEDNKQDISDEYTKDIENIIYPLLYDIEDWYNNEGGEGVVILDLNEKTYSIDNRIRYIEYNNYNHSGDFTEFIENV